MDGVSQLDLSLNNNVTLNGNVTMNNTVAMNGNMYVNGMLFSSANSEYTNALKWGMMINQWDDNNYINTININEYIAQW